MIAIDTNVLLRYLLADDPQQSKMADSIIKSHCPVLLTDIVLVEAVWTLTGKRYGFDKDGIYNVVRALVSDGVFHFEDMQVVWTALCNFEESKPVRGKALDFADALIVAKSHSVALKSGIELEAFYSFDKAVQLLTKVIRAALSSLSEFSRKR